LELFQDLLSMEGFEVTTLSDPTVVVERLRDEVFHLVVLDQTMPKLTGLELLGEIRAFDDDIAVIMTTVNPSLETAAASIPYGVSAYIRLPLGLDEFRDAIAWIMKKKGFVSHREDDDY